MKEWVLTPSSSGPLASRPPLGIGLLRRPRGDSLHLGVFMRWFSTHGGLASGSSGSQTSWYGLLVYVQGASDSLPHSFPGSGVVASGFWHSGTGVAPGNIPSYWHGCLPGAGSVFVRLYLLRIVSLSLRFLFWSAGSSRSPEFLRCSRTFLWCGGPVQFVTLPGVSLWFFRAWLGLGGAPPDIRRACFLFWMHSSSWPRPRLGALGIPCYVFQWLFFRERGWVVLLLSSRALWRCAQAPPLLLGLRASLYWPDQRKTITMGDCYILCGRSGVPGPLGRRIVSDASRSCCRRL